VGQRWAALGSARQKTAEVSITGQKLGRDRQRRAEVDRSGQRGAEVGRSGQRGVFTRGRAGRGGWKWAEEGSAGQRRAARGLYPGARGPRRAVHCPQALSSAAHRPGTPMRGGIQAPDPRLPEPCRTLTPAEL
jgi:hypothetical protein